jgi:hypothetical protein
VKRRTFVLTVLADTNPSYDELCRAVIEAFPERNKYRQKVHAVRAVRDALWDELAVCEADETVWLTPTGWTQARERGRLLPRGPYP